LVERRLVTIEKVPNERIKILWTDVYQDGEEVIVSGALKQHTRSSSSVKIHVDASVIALDGNLIEQARSPYIYVPKNLSGKRVRFRIHLKNSLPKGSQIRLTVDAQIHNDT
jgi:PDZ domain-containing secreted protein